MTRLAAFIAARRGARAVERKSPVACGLLEPEIVELRKITSGVAGVECRPVLAVQILARPAAWRRVVLVSDDGSEARILRIIAGRSAGTVVQRKRIVDVGRQEQIDAAVALAAPSQLGSLPTERGCGRFQSPRMKTSCTGGSVPRM